MMVCRCWFISSGEMTTQGRLFCISAPRVGSRLTSHTSSCCGEPLTTATGCDRTHSVLPSLAGVRHCLHDLRNEKHAPNLGAAVVPERSQDNRFRHATLPSRRTHIAR